MENVYFGDWNCEEDMIKDFGIEKSVLDEYKVLYAWYEYANYTGEAFVLLKKDEKLYEVNGNHCSCYQLENQFEPEETFTESLLQTKRNFFDKEKLIEIIENI